MTATPVMIRTRNTETVDLKPSADRKVTTYARLRKKGWVPLVLNAFGLTQGESCPGATEGEGGCLDPCYVHDAGRWPSTMALLAHNLTALRTATFDMMVVMLSAVVAIAVRQHAQYVGDGKPLVYRIHWSGDFFSARYAMAWAAVARRFPEVRFWTYTRSFEYVEHLVGIENLTLYLSADPVNIAQAEAVAARYSLPIAYMGEGMPERDGRPFRRLLCPETSGRMPMVLDDGRGACVACQACIRGNRDIVFRMH